MPIHPQTAPRSEERGAVRARSRASPGGSPLPRREQRKHLLGEGHEAGSRRWEWKRPARRGTAPAPRTSLAPPQGPGAPGAHARPSSNPDAPVPGRFKNSQALSFFAPYLLFAN